MAVTFRSLEGPGADAIVTAGMGSALGDWYCRVRDIRLQCLTVGDLSRSCRQGICFSEIVPIALERLRAEPESGEMYDGELLSAVVGIPLAFWTSNPECATEALQIAKCLPPELDTEVAAKVERFVRDVVPPAR